MLSVLIKVVKMLHYANWIHKSCECMLITLEMVLNENGVYR